MKTLEGHLLLYDKDCPLCCWYTNLFVRNGLLSAGGRVAFQEIDQEKYHAVDYDIARDKIALLETGSNKVFYGIDAISRILSIPFPFVGHAMKLKPVYWFMENLYAFISMNRKIVIPVSCRNATSCNPSKNWFWRMFFIVFCCLFMTMLAAPFFHAHLQQYFCTNIPFSDAVFFAGQLLFQCLACLLLKERNIYDYLGHVSLVSLLGAVWLAFGAALLNLLEYSGLRIDMLQPFIYGAVFAWMFMEHRRRIRVADMHPALNYTWLLYRALIYPLVFCLR